MRSTLSGIVLCCLASVLSSCSIHSTSAASVQPQMSMRDSENCLAAATKAIGADAEVLKCGHLTDPKALDVIAGVRLKRFKITKTGIPVSKLVILTKKSGDWEPELKVDKWITNAMGYIGLSFIDDSSQHVGYRVSFADKRSDDSSGFTVFFSFLGPEGDSETEDIQVSWNPQVQRFQEYSANDEPLGFRAEIKNPPHRNCADCKRKK